MKDAKKSKEQLIAELAESEEKYRIQVEMATDAVFLETLEGRILECNAAGAKMFGYTKKEIVGLTIADLVPKDFVKELPKIITEKETTYGKFVPRISKKKDGTIFPTEIATKLINIGEKPRLIVYIRDITERKRAEKKRKLLLKKEREQHLKAETLAKVALILTSRLSLSAVLEEVLRQVKLLVPYSACNIVLIQKGGLTNIHSMGYEKYGSKNFVNNFRYPLVKIPLVKEVVKLAKPRLISDTYQNPRWIFFKETSWIRAHLVVPICLGDKVIGLLNLDDDTSGKFVKDDIKKLQPLANAAAIALENARLFEEVRKEITERKQAEKALVESEKKYRTVFENTGTATVIIEEDKTISMVNTQSEKLTGYSKDEIENKMKWTDFVIPEDLKMMEKYHRERRKAGRKVPAEYEFRLIDKKGHIKNTFLKVEMIPGSKKSIASLTDITERKLAEQAIQESENRFRELFKNISSGVAIYEAKNNGRDFIIKEFNRAAEKIEKVKKEDIIGKSVLKVFPGVKDFGLFKVFQEVYKTGKPQHHPISLYQDQRIAGWRENYVYKLPSGEIVAVYDDITERKQAEEEIKDLNQVILNFISSVPVILTRVNENGIYTQSLGSGLKKWGLKENQLLGVNIFDAYPQIKDKINNVLKGGEEKFLHEGIYNREKFYFQNYFFPDKIIGKGMIAISFDITERKQAEEQIKDSEKRLKILFDYAPDAYYISDLKGNFIDGNIVAERLMGYKKEELIRSSFLKLKLLSIADIAKADELLVKNRRGQPTGPDEFILNRKDNSKVTVEISTYPVKIKGRTLVLGIARDITERKKAEELLTHERDLIQTLFENHPDFIYFKDHEARFHRVSKRFCAFFGLSMEDIIGKTDLELFPEEIAEQSYSEDLHVIKTGTPLVNKEENAGGVWVLTTKIPWFDKEGNIIGLFGISRDITERKQAEEELRLHAAMMDNVAEGVCLIGLDDLFIKWTNERFARMFGYDPGEMVGKQVDSVNAPTERTPTETRKSIVDALKETGEWHGEIRSIKRDGTHFWCYANVSLFDHPEYGKVMVSANTDITERKQAEENLKNTKNELQIIMDSVPATIFYKDIEGRIIRVNKTLADLLKIPVEDIIGKTVDELFPKEQAEKMTKDDREVVVSGKPKRDIIHPLTTPDGIRWLTTDKIPYKDKKGKVTGVIGLSKDITVQIKSEQKLQQTYKRLKKTMDATIDTMSKMIEAKDPYTAGHQHRVCQLAVPLAQELGLSEDKIEGIRIASLIHDIGKIGLPTEILSKPSKQTDVEFNLIKGHSKIGYDILKPIDFSYPIAQIVLQHHERTDGTGYDQGLRGNKILLEARIIGLADVVEAMSSHRPYRPALGIDKALEEISRNKGILYDSKVVDACLKLFKEKGFKFK